MERCRTHIVNQVRDQMQGCVYFLRFVCCRFSYSLSLIVCGACWWSKEKSRGLKNGDKKKAIANQGWQKRKERAESTKPRSMPITSLNIAPSLDRCPCCYIWPCISAHVSRFSCTLLSHHRVDLAGYKIQCWEWTKGPKGRKEMEKVERWTDRR